MNTAKIFSTILAAAAVALPLAVPAHAGYDEDNSRATGSYSSNRRTASSNASAMYGSYTTTRVVTTTTMPATGWISVEGVLTEDADDKNFAIRDAWGRTFNVETSRFSGADASNKLQKGQRVRVYGSWEDEKLFATNLREVTGVASGTRIRYKSVYYTVGQLNSISGTLVTDADDDEFELRATNGQTYMIRTRSVAESLKANKLQEGQRVRVYGYWIAEADGEQPQLEAINLRVM